jgi:hypothetical protein
MNMFFAAGATVLAMTASAAMAQTTTSSQTTTTLSPAVIAPAPIVPPPVGTLSSTRTEKTIDADGTQTDKASTTYRNAAGVADDSVTKTTTYPPVAVTTEKTSTTSVTQ